MTLESIRRGRSVPAVDPAPMLADRWLSEANKAADAQDETRKWAALDCMSDIETELGALEPTTAAGVLAKLYVYAAAGGIHGDIDRLLGAGGLSAREAATLRRLDNLLFGERGA